MANALSVFSFVTAGGLAAATALAAPTTGASATAPAASSAKPAASASAPAAATPAAPPAGDDRAALAGRVVVLARGPKALGLGVVLNGDGRILAALSSLAGDTRHLDVHYADGKVVPARVGHADGAHDLALVVPQNAQHKLGLRAAREATDALHAPLGSFTNAGMKAAPGPLLHATGPSAVNGSDGKPFPEALAFTTPLAATSAGSPLLDQNGEVVAVVTRACERKPAARCTPVFVGTPVTLVREFLRTAPKTASLPAASLGVQVVPDESGAARGLRVTAARGPAAAAGLHAGPDARSADVIVALDGVPMTTSESFERFLDDRAVGDVVDVLVLGSGRYRHVTLVLAAPPR